MSIRQKFLGTVIVITICLILIFYFVISHVINKNFAQLERTMVVDSLERVKATFASQTQGLDALVRDWASWDETDLFIRNRDDTFAAPNIVEDTFISTAKIDMLLIYSNEGKLAHGVSFNKNNKSLEDVDGEMLEAITAYDHLLDQTVQDKSKMGIIQAGDRYLIIAARPILDSNDTKPAHGTLIMGSILDEDKIARLQRLTRTSLDFSPIDNGGAEITDVRRRILSSDSLIHVAAKNDEVINGYALLNDVSGKPVLILSIDLPRTIYQQSQNTLSFVIQAIILISIIFGLTFFFFIDIIISRRLTAIISDIGEIEKNSLPGSRIRESRLKDELGKLAISINHMLQANEVLEEYKTKHKKLEALATFSAGATHELATPLSAIAVASGEILHDLVFNETNNDELYDDIFLIREQVDRCKYILNQMGADAGQHMGEEVKSFSIKELIEDTLSFFQKTVVKQITVDNRISNQPVVMPFLSLRRVLRGIIRNSIDASEAGKTIVLTCFESSTHLFFETRDEGNGMDDKTLHNATDPFFTTKTVGNNLGLGLYLAQSLAGRFGGSLEISSTLLKGTTVTLSLAKENIYG